MGQLLSRLESLVHFHEVFVHLLEVLIDELVDDLRRQVNPDVEDSVLVFAFKSLEQVLFHIGHDCMSPAEIHLVPAPVCLAVANTLSADLAISKQMVDEFNGEDFNLIDFLKSADVDVVAFSDVEEHTVNEEQKCLHV